MRVTNKMLANNYLTDMSTNLNNLQTIQQQMSTGKNFTKPSDDPFNVARSMQMHTAIDANTQYNKNITNTINWLDTTDTALNQLGNVFQGIRERLVSSGNAAYGSDERSKIKDEINQRIGQVSQILNTTFAGEYIFGGTKGASKPVDAIMDSSVGEVTNTVAGGKGTVGGKFYGSGNAKFTIEVAAVDSSGKATKVNVLKTTASGTTSTSTVSLNKDNKFDIGNDLTFSIETNTINKAPTIDPTTKKETASGSTYTFDCTSAGNAKLIYCKADGTELNTDTVESDPNSEDALQFNMIDTKRQTEISQGVLADYNVSASEVIKYGDEDNDDLRSLLSRIVNNLDGKDANGVSNEDAATKALANEDLADLDKAIKQTLKIRSQVGAKQNRMDSAKEQNVQGNTNMTDILSKTEDIDVTQKTMEFAVAQTVYLASLQTSAKVLQPTLMDYMR
ncbi:flagellar hook-associated protein FlgL [Clostridium sp. P21]|uniref:Flagellar hook-associated protein FlgL n=1 Tax=Clostridium muellerianum TaxID=2716538 RepID=A0A7Y0ED36_9CLOT|nr:flagellar hook-associated protein FlgL [Clostridium muellerianum]NMM61269.1 flagellar hook-associated protein FlgL [Clostridium muellerianum]